VTIGQAAAAAAVPPFKAKVIEPIRLPDAAERAEAIEAAGYNTFLLRSEQVFIDLLTDSGTSALSQEQRAMMELGDEAYAGSRSFFRLEQAMREVYGYRYLIPTHQGRGAEHLLSQLLVKPGMLVPSNLYFTTSRQHVELAGGVWCDVSIAEAVEPANPHPFKGNLDLDKLEALLEGAAAGRSAPVAFVRVETCLNMAGGQPLSLRNLRAVRGLCDRWQVPLFLDATRAAENALFISEREPGEEGRPLPAILRELAELSDGAIFSSKKDHFVPIGGMLCLNDERLLETARDRCILYEGFPHYGGMSGAAMEALAQGIREAAQPELIAHYVGQSRRLGGQLAAAGVPIVEPVGAHAVFLDAKRFCPHIPQEQFPAQSLVAALYLAGGIRSMERGIVSAQHGHEPYDGLELVRLTLPRRVYGSEHLDFVAAVCSGVHQLAHELPGLEMTFEPEHLRFFQARFKPRAAYPAFT